MKEKIIDIGQSALTKIMSAKDLKELDDIRVEFLGKKGQLTAFLRGMGNISAEEKPIMGKIINEVREQIEKELKEKKEKFEDSLLELKLKTESIDISLDNRKIPVGHKHPLYQVQDEIIDIIASMGFSVAEGPEIEFVKYNFDLLNVPADHPARDEGDTYYFDNDIILRTQTSPVQARVMLEQKPPIKIISPGKVYRRDEIDATHSPLFHQVEGLIVDKGITLSDLKGTLDYVAKRLYGSETETVFRPHQFYFTEPSAEVDATCFVCKGEGCRVCKNSGFIEILGCGMVHPNVLRMCGIDPNVYSGFAFGMGLDRMVMLKYGINDMRLLFNNDVEFLSQF